MHQMDIQKAYLAKQWKKLSRSSRSKNKRRNTKKTRKTMKAITKNQYTRLHSMDRQYLALTRTRNHRYNTRY